MSKGKKKARLPKRIAGVKVPKALRRSRLADLLSSPVGKQIVADAVVALAGAATAVAAGKAATSPKARRLAHEAKADVGQAGHEAAHDVSAAGATLVHAFTEAAHAFAEALRQGPPAEPRSFASADDDPPWTPEEPSAVRSGRKKQQTAYEAGPL